MGQRMYKFIGPLICNQNRPGRVTQNLTREIEIGIEIEEQAAGDRIETFSF